MNLVFGRVFRWKQLNDKYLECCIFYTQFLERKNEILAPFMALSLSPNTK